MPRLWCRPEVLFFVTLTAFASEAQTSRQEMRQWFSEARFGMFIHWGVYSLLGKGVWVMENDGMSVEAYEQLPSRFNPVDCDPAEWVGVAKDAGMRYIITSKHHDGFAMRDSDVRDYDIVDRTPLPMGAPISYGPSRVPGAGGIGEI